MVCAGKTSYRRWILHATLTIINIGMRYTDDSSKSKDCSTRIVASCKQATDTPSLLIVGYEPLVNAL